MATILTMSSDGNTNIGCVRITAYSSRIIPLQPRLFCCHYQLLSLILLCPDAKWPSARRGGFSSGESGIDFSVEVLPHTVPELRRRLWALVWARPPDRDAVLG